MKRDLRKILILFLVFSGFMNVVYAQEIILSTQIKSRYLGYINFKQKQIVLFDSVLNLPLRDLTNEKIFQEMFFNFKQKLQVFSDSLENGEIFSPTKSEWRGEKVIFSPTKFEWIGKQKIPDSFVNLLCDNGLVEIARSNGYRLWLPAYSSDTDIKHFKDWYEFWFLGKITINPNFESYLMLVRDLCGDDTGDSRFLFLLNVKDNIITSLVRIAYNQFSWGEGPYFFTKAASQGKYCFYGIEYTTCRFINRFGRLYNEPKLEKYTYYSFDNNGYVQLQELKGRKKFIFNKYKYKQRENIR